MKYQKSWTESFLIGYFFYTNHIVKTKSNFPLFSSKAKLFFDVFDEVVFFSRAKSDVKNAPEKK